MKDLKQVNSELLNKGLSGFDINTGSQSFVKYPTNYIDVHFYGVVICIGEIVYNNINLYDHIVDNIKLIADTCLKCNDETGLFIEVGFVDDCYRVSIQELDDQMFEEKDTSDLKELLNYIESFK